MKAISTPLIIFCFTIPVSLLAQTGQVKGSILDAKTNQPLPFANVFIDRTTMGAVADSSGHFVISPVQEGVYEIIASSVGYIPFRRVLEIKDSKPIDIEIKLESEAKELGELVVAVKKDKEWEVNHKKFERVFLGTGKEAKGCRIVNPWVLEFRYENGQDGKTFKAKASQPLEIENSYLGYRLFYYLKDFSAQSNYYAIVGFQRFEIMQTKDSTLARRWHNRRMETYLGSYRHLFKAILDHRSKEEGFDLYVEGEAKKDVYNPKNVSTENLISLDPSTLKIKALTEGQYKIQLATMEVHYKRKYMKEGTIYATYELELSSLDATNGFLIVNSNGVVVNSTELIVSGVMFEKRVACHLPFDYKPAIDLTQ